MKETGFKCVMLDLIHKSYDKYALINTTYQTNYNLPLLYCSLPITYGTNKRERHYWNNNLQRPLKFPLFIIMSPEECQAFILSVIPLRGLAQFIAGGNNFFHENAFNMLGGNKSVFTDANDFLIDLEQTFLRGFVDICT